MSATNDKRYQVFVSSTYTDLQKERQGVMQALLQMDCMPSGMELFPAADEDQWTLITKVIDDCDYYIVIIGGRYGSKDKEGISYTEKEHRYANAQGKPILAFLHKNPEEIALKDSETDEEAKNALIAFRASAKINHCNYYTSSEDLVSKVIISLVNLIKTRPAIGWVRADKLSQETTEELLELRRKNEALEKKLTAISNEAPQGAEELAQGEDEFLVRFREEGQIDDRLSMKKSMTWNDIFSIVGPDLLRGSFESDIYGVLCVHLREMFINEAPNERKWFMCELYKQDFDTIKIQLKALGLITKGVLPKDASNTATYWKLTPYGENYLTKLRAIKRKDI